LNVPTEAGVIVNSYISHSKMRGCDWSNVGAVVAWGHYPPNAYVNANHCTNLYMCIVSS